MKVNEPERGTGRINTVRPTPYRPGRNASQQNTRKKLAHNSTHKTVANTTKPRSQAHLENYISLGYC